jgi:hypothetical protein
MLRKIKYSKIAIVIFLTVLIWVWADLALDETYSVPGPLIIVAESSPSLWVCFGEEPSIPINNIKLKGPASKLSDVKRKLKDGSLSFEFFLDAEQEGMAEPREHTLDVRNFLRKSDQIRIFGLTVVSCEPAKLTVNVVKLIEKTLNVQCFDGSGNSLKAESINPPEVKMFVPEDWEGERLTAQVRLTPGEIEQAKSAPIKKVPYIILAANQKREATTVEIKMSPEENPLSEFTIEATYAIALSPNLQGEYRVEVTNRPQLMSHIAIRATPNAARAYEHQPLPKMTLYILDGDKKKGQDEQQKKVVYNFPEEFVRKGEIKLQNPQQPAVAKFKLIPIPSAENQ